jgi:hypothetical protein
MKEEKRTVGYTFPYLSDETQAVAQASRAACTPDFFVFDKDRRLAYRGRMATSRRGNGKPKGADSRAALDAVPLGRSLSPEQVLSSGCNIKWKPGNEPAWQEADGLPRRGARPEHPTWASRTGTCQGLMPALSPHELDVLPRPLSVASSTGCAWASRTGTGTPNTLTPPRAVPPRTLQVRPGTRPNGAVQVAVGFLYCSLPAESL